MTPQKGGYIVIDCTPLWKDNGAIEYDEGSFSAYASDDQEINKIIYNAMLNKKPIILNNLVIYDGGNNGTYTYNGLVAHTIEFSDGLSGGNSIRVFTENWNISLECSVDQRGVYTLSIYGVVKQ